MLPRTFLTQLIPARIAEALRRIEASIWRPLPDARVIVQQTDSFRTHRRPDEIASANFSPVPEQAFHWGPKFAQRWFRVLLPSITNDEPTHLIWEDQAEATAYIDGVPHYGLDLAHRHCPLPKGTREILVEAVCVKTGIWLDGSAPPLDEAGSRYHPPRLVQRDERAWSLYHDLRVLLDILEAECEDHQPGAKKSFDDPVRHSPPLFRASPLFRRWCDRLDRAIDRLDREGADAFGVELKKILADFPADPLALRAVLTGHAHIDLVWLWPERVGTFKATHSWATQVHLLEKYPEFKFAYSQPASYAAVALKSPALHQRVRALMQAGRWEATGASYVECDTQIPCGEALLRGLRLGQQDFKTLRGSPAKVCWLPDVFGYSGILPQLLRGFGVEGFFTTKLSWNTVNRLPHTSFRWRGPDGAEVLAHIVHLHDYNEAVDIRHLREDALHHQQAAAHPEFLVPTGYGDGGGGPTEEMCERARRIANLAGVPRTEWGGIEPFFQRLQSAAPELPEVAGELLFELHRGVFTTHGKLKNAFRKLERALQTLEAVHIVRGQGPIARHYWQRLVFSQFHDYVPGSSIWEVYAEGIPELENLSTQASKAGAALLNGSNSEEPGWFNPLPLSRTWIDRSVCYELPALSGAPLGKLPRRSTPAPSASANLLESSRVSAAFDASGGLLRLLIDGHPLVLAGSGHQLCAYPDHPTKFEAWDVDRAALVGGIPARFTGNAIVGINGLSASVSFSYQVATKSAVTVRYSLNAEEPALRITYDIDWHDPKMLLKGIFATRYLGREARFGAPFGSSLRGQWPGYTREEAQWEVPASRWVVVMDDAQSEGLAIITEAKYGFTVRDGVVGVSLLRSAPVTGAAEHALIRETPDRPDYSDLGRHEVHLALGRFAIDLPMEDQPAALADTLFTPCVSCAGVTLDSGLRGIEAAPSLIPAWADPLDARTWVLRLHETLGRRGTARLMIADGWKAKPVGMTGEIPDDSNLPHLWCSNHLSLPYEPYQVLSVAFARNRVQSYPSHAGPSR